MARGHPHLDLGPGPDVDRNPPTTASPVRIGGLCFGYGGLDLAVQQVIPDAHLAWYSEIDPGANKIAAHRFPGIPNVGDMTKVDWTRVEPVDILTGGTPCQDLSHAGKRAGMTEGTRSNLWVAMREAIAQLHPSLVVWENVGGAASAEADSEVEPCPGCVGDGSRVSLRALGRVVGDLSSLGYVGRVRSLRAADVGAPHGRLRYFLAAHPADPARRVRIEPRASSGTSRGGEGEAWADLRENTRSGDSGALLPTPAVNDMGEGKTPEVWDEWTAAMQAKHGNGNGHGKSLAIEAQRLLPTPTAGDGEGGGIKTGVTAERLAMSTGDGGASRLRDTAGLPPDQWGVYADAITRWETLTRPAPPPTQPSKKGTPQLSPKFSEWMMGLPNGWVTDVPGVTRNEALKAIGNGVCPQQAGAALRFLLGVSTTPVPTAVASLLPTPEASDGSGGRVASEYGGKRDSGAKRSVTLATAVAHRVARCEEVIMTWTVADFHRALVAADEAKDFEALTALVKHGPDAYHCGGWEVHAWPCPPAAAVLDRLLGGVR